MAIFVKLISLNLHENYLQQITFKFTGVRYWQKRYQPQLILISFNFWEKCIHFLSETKKRCDVTNSRFLFSFPLCFSVLKIFCPKCVLFWITAVQMSSKSVAREPINFYGNIKNIESVKQNLAIIFGALSQKSKTFLGIHRSPTFFLRPQTCVIFPL